MPVAGPGRGRTYFAETETEKRLLRTLEQKLGKRLDRGPMVPAQEPKVVVISGPSGVGKDAVIEGLKRVRRDMHFVVTATSRAARTGEVDGVDYFFVSTEQFEEWIEQKQLLEHAVVYGEYKGIPKQQVEEALKKNTDVVLRIDVQGAATVKRMIPHAISIFLVAESEASLVKRLVSRKTEPLDKLVIRVDTARDEVKRLQEFDYVVVNEEGQLDKCVETISSIIDADKARCEQLPVEIE